MFKKNITSVGHFNTLVIGVGIGYMSFVTGGLESPYYAGLNWIAIGSLAFWPAKPIDRFLSVATIFFPLLAMVIWRGDNLFEIQSLLSLTFMGGTIVLSTLINILSMKAHEQEYQLRNELMNLNKNKDIIIEQKSSDVANLKRLAKQFSPAVIRAIESQSISLNQRDRKDVTIIFLDIADSTTRSNLIDHADYQKALDIFFNIAIKKLLSKNITVANFMGDGLMAIANAPYTAPRHQALALETCLEILQETNALQKQLREYWKSEFKIRIGISSGFATVGFFPNNDFGVYTAIGDSVNLSSRLCSTAASNTIALTKRVIVEAGDTIELAKVRTGGSIENPLRFSNIRIEYFLAEPTEFKKSIDIDCPLCKSPLEEPKDLGDCWLIKCTSCRYSDIQQKEEEEAAA